MTADCVSGDSHGTAAPYLKMTKGGRRDGGRLVLSFRGSGRLVLSFRGSGRLVLSFRGNESDRRNLRSEILAPYLRMTGRVTGTYEGKAMTFSEKVYEYLKTVPEGRVVTYGMIAAAIGSPRASRQVGNALHRNPYPVVVPCHRVVNREGRLAPAFAFGGWEKQAELLRAEGVEVNNGYVEMCKYAWNGE